MQCQGEYRLIGREAQGCYVMSVDGVDREKINRARYDITLDDDNIVS